MTTVRIPTMGITTTYALRVHRDGSDSDLLVTVATGTTVADLASALGLPLPLAIDGRPVSGQELVVDSGVRQGSLLGSSTPQSATASSDRATLHQVAGLSAGGSVGLPIGTNIVGVVGPARGGLRRTETRPAGRFVLTVPEFGPVTVEPATGEPVLINGMRCTGSPIGKDLVDLGSAVFRVSFADEALRVPATIRTTDYEGRVLLADPALRVALPTEGPMVDIPDALFSSPRGLRKRRALRQRDALRSEVVEALGLASTDAAQARRARHPDICQLLGRLDSGSGLWERASNDPDVLRSGVGSTDAIWSPVRPDQAVPELLVRDVRRASQLFSVPLVVDLADHRVIALTGPRHAAHSVARWVLVEAALLHGPDVVSIRVATSRPAAWDWVKWFPHMQSSAPFELVLSDGARPPATAVGTTRVTLQITNDVPDGMARLDVDEDGLVAWSPAGAVVARGLAVGIGRPEATAAAQRLRTFGRPVSPTDLPPFVALDALLGLDDPVRLADGIMERWRMGNHTAPYGRDARHLVGLTIDSDPSPLLVTGAQGTGRSNALRTMALSLAATHPAEQLRLALVDAEGSGAYAGFEVLPHVVCSGATLPSNLVGGPDLVVLVDEVTMLLTMEPDQARLLERLVAEGSRLVVATRRPATFLTSNLGNLAFDHLLLHQTRDSALQTAGVYLDDHRTEHPGRAVVAPASGEQRVVQLAVPTVSAPGTSARSVEVRPFTLAGIDAESATARALNSRTLLAAIDEASRRVGSTRRH